MSYHLGITLGFESQYVVQMSCIETLLSRLEIIGPEKAWI